MKHIALAVLLAAAPFAAGGDTLSDLRQTLERFPAKAPFAAPARVQINATAQEDAGRAGESGSTSNRERGDSRSASRRRHSRPRIGKQGKLRARHGVATPARRCD
jgi:hypothetical protein